MKTIHAYLGIREFKRHSLVLLVAGTVYILIGVSYIATDLSPPRANALDIALRWLTIDQWGAVFIMSGLLAILSSRWPPFSETWGYTVLTGLSSGWAAFYVVGVLFADAAATNLTASLSWGVIAFLWWAISGLVNPEDTIPVLRAEIAALQSEIKALKTRRE